MCLLLSDVALSWWPLRNDARVLINSGSCSLVPTVSIASALTGDDDDEGVGAVVDVDSNEAFSLVSGTIVVGVKAHDSDWERARGPKCSDILLAELEPIWGLYPQESIFRLLVFFLRRFLLTQEYDYCEVFGWFVEYIFFCSRQIHVPSG